jgi:hypothetical protein
MGMLSLFFKLPLIFLTPWHRWRCPQCGNTWR